MKTTRENLKQLIREVLDNNEVARSKSKKVLFETSKATYAMQHLDETTMKALQGKYNEQGFIVLTPDRTCRAEKKLPEGEFCSPEEEAAQELTNKKNREEMKQLIRAAGWGFTPTLGGYKEQIIDPDGKMRKVDTDKPEHSFLIMAKNESSRLNHKELRNFGIEMARKYNQDSFFYKPPDSVDTNSYYIDQDGNVDLKFSGRTYGDLSQDYYTQLAKGTEKHHPEKRFTALPESLMFPLPPLNATDARNRRGEIFVPRRGDK